jgi:hypothetical protein
MRDQRHAGTDLWIAAISLGKYDGIQTEGRCSGKKSEVEHTVADIHGEADRFHAMLEKIRFSDEDTLYIIGDVIDRGPDGIKLLQEIGNKQLTFFALTPYWFPRPTQSN